MKNTSVLPVLKSLNESQNIWKEVEIWILESERMHATRFSVVVLMREAANFCISNSTKSSALRTPILYRIGGHLLQKLYDMSDEFKNSMKPNYFSFMNEKLSEVWTRKGRPSRSLKEHRIILVRPERDVNLISRVGARSNDESSRALSDKWVGRIATAMSMTKP